ncbi:MAG: Hpt domain-containing protein [Proteobacteria bacterium]|nr:Hpt domain-containing protein [Pseudomonadota bacterium]MBU1737007.1 Hpt domain-containing protein [Pseudomonadota bacterium]
MTTIDNDPQGSDQFPVDYPRLLDERCRGKKDLAARLLRNLAEDSGPRWLVDAEGVVKTGDMANISRIGHSIKGSCKMLYAESMVSAGMKLEKAGKAGSLQLAGEALDDLKKAFTEACNWLQQNRELIK